MARLQFSISLEKLQSRRAILNFFNLWALRVTEDPSTQESHYDNDRVFTTEATIKIKRFTRGTHSSGKILVFLATIAEGKTAASDKCKPLTSFEATCFLQGKMGGIFPQRDNCP